MNNLKKLETTLVVTTIQQPNDVMIALATGAVKSGWSFVVIGDKKGPSAFNLPEVNFYDLQRQATLDFSYAKFCPVGHYARKNIGYLIAMASGADVIVETDDDNFPLEEFFAPRERNSSAQASNGEGWINIYRYFHKSNIWPRGFPLRYIHAPTSSLTTPELISAPIQQGLADQNPDVDAIYRLVAELPVNFDTASNIVLNEGQYCPYNSQNTTTFKEAFPLLYLPAHCSFRMTDIWRSLVAVRICHAFGWKVLYHRPTVYQKRNDHDLMRDFADEIDGYLYNEAIVALLKGLNLSKSMGAIIDNLRVCYNALTREGYVGPGEMDLLEAWLQDIKSI
jgi:hypothetical protein